MSHYRCSVSLPKECRPVQCTEDNFRAVSLHIGGFYMYHIFRNLFTSFCHENAPGTLCALLEIY